MKRLSLTIALVAVLSLAGAGCGNTRPAIATPSTLAGVSLAHPLIAAQRMSLAAARHAVNFPVLQASVAVARPANLTAVWVNRKTQAVALVYGHGDVTIMMARALYSDPRTELSRFMSQSHATARLGSVNRDIALVIEPHSDAKRSNPAWVEFDDKGVDVNVASAKQGTAVLLKVARSLGVAQGPTTRTVPVCGPSSRHTLKSSRTARVYVTGHNVFGCSRATKRRTFLGTDSTCVGTRRVGPFALNGDLVAYGSESCGVDTGFAQVLVRRLSDGVWLLNARAHLLPLGPESWEMVDSIVLNVHGAVAWIASGFSVIARQGEDTEVADAYHKGERLLDSGATIHRRSLRLVGIRIRWRDGNSWRNAPLPGRHRG